MKILMLTPYLPYPPVGGGQTRSYNLIKYLGRKHEITLFSFIKSKSEEVYVREMKKYCKKVVVFQRPAKPWTIRNILKTGFSLYPFLVIRNWTDGVLKKVEEELKSADYDLIHAENFYVMPYIPKTRVPVIFIEQTIFYKVYEHYIETLPWYKSFLKPILYIDVVKLRQWELHYWREAKYISAVSEEDRQHIARLSRRRDIHIIPNGVDYEQFSKIVYPKSEKPLVLFGNADFHWMQNKEGAMLLLEEIWPQIKEKVPDAKLWITGKIAPKILSGYTNLSDVLIEEVPVDKAIEPYQRSWLLVAPMKSGGGSRTKFFEAMASGLAIVTTRQGIEGIAARNGREAVVSDDLQKLARQAIKLIADRKLRESFGEKAKALVKRKYTWDYSARILDNLYNNVLKNEKA
jgi:glycosyltransferase involved in cell wall biosynthesis